MMKSWTNKEKNELPVDVLSNADEDSFKEGATAGGAAPKVSPDVQVFQKCR